MKLIDVLSILFSCHLAQAANLLSCQMSDGDHLQSQFTVSDNGNGLELEASSCKGLAHAVCQPYSTHIPVKQDLVDILGHEYLASTFHGDKIQIVHIFGAYQYSDASSGLTLQFPDSDCQRPPGDPEPVKPSLCLTAGRTTNGKLIGLKVYEQPDGTGFVAMETVSVFHGVVYSFDESSRIEIPLHKQHLCTGRFYYYGDDFQLSVSDSDPIGPGSALGTINATFAGVPVSSQVFNADDLASGFCE